MSNIKNENTLFRFVSLRAPELTKEEGNTRRFVFHPSMAGTAFTAVSGRPANTTKWSALQSFSAGFSAYANETAVRTALTDEFYKTAAWMVQNRFAFDNDEMFTRVSGFSPLSDALVLSLWNNLFYQVVGQKNFYVKESVMQALVLNNMLVRLSAFSTIEERKTHLFELANARVVLPTELFDEKIPLPPKNPINVPATPSSDQAEQEALIRYQRAINEASRALKEVKKIQRSYQKDVAKIVETAAKQYKVDTQAALDNYEAALNAAKRETCTTPLSGTPTDNNSSFFSFCAEPDIPAMEWKKPVINLPEVTTYTDRLSGETQGFLEDFFAENPEALIEEIIDYVETYISEAEMAIAERATFSKEIIFINGIPIDWDQPEPDYSATNAPIFKPDHFGVRQLGIADYKKVVSHVCCYSAGEVAHIENIMARELRSKSTTRERVEENTETTETSQETETLTDSTSTQRFQMQTEVAKLIQQQKEVHADASFSAKYTTGVVSLELGVSGGFSNATSKEESNKQAVTQSKDLTQRAMERVVTKVRTEIIRKTTESFKEENIHEFDNRAGANHVSGVFRFINAVYKNQIYNYGKRLMYEFIIPQPSKMHRLGMMENTNSTDAVKLPRPVDPRILYPQFSLITEYNYATIAGSYGADVDPFPEKEKFLDFATSKNDINPPTPPVYKWIGEKGFAFHSAEFKIPDEYEVESVTGVYSGSGIGFSPANPRVSVSIGGKDAFYNSETTFIQQIASVSNSLSVTFPFQNRREKISITVTTWDQRSFGINLIAKCKLTAEALRNWQLKTYKAILDAYERQLQEYNSASSDVMIKGTNPGFYRQTEQLVLRKNCIGYLVPDDAVFGQSFYTVNNPPLFKDFKIVPSAELDNYASLAKFLEQGFEWDEMSYTFYPYYWGNRNEWKDLYQYDCDDPLFRNFMQAGLARVVVTVRPGFEEAMMLYMGTGQIWNAGQVPVIGDPLYLSIVDELKEQEYVVEETWDTVVPTSLVGLQQSGVAIVGSGLPCGDECEEHSDGQIAKNVAILGVTDINPEPPTEPTIPGHPQPIPPSA